MASNARRSVGEIMPDAKTKKRVEQDQREGKSASTQAGEFVREEMEHIREGKHGARSAKQAIPMGLSKPRRPGVPFRVPKKVKTPRRTLQQAKRDVTKGKQGSKRPSATR